MEPKRIANKRSGSGRHLGCDTLENGLLPVPERENRRAGMAADDSHLGLHGRDPTHPDAKIFPEGGRTDSTSGTDVTGGAVRFYNLEAVRPGGGQGGVPDGIESGVEYVRGSPTLHSGNRFLRGTTGDRQQTDQDEEEAKGFHV